MRQRFVPSLRGQRGFTLVETMVAALILMVGVLGTFVMIDGANKTTRDNNARTAASAIARDVLEHARTLQYTRVAPATLVADLRAKPELAGTLDANGNWVLRQRNLTVTVSASVCTYDDPADGRGDPAVALANACPAGHAGAGAATSVDSNPDDFRRVTLTMQWNQGGRTRQMTQTSQLNNPGGGLGPRILTFPNPLSGAQVTSGTTIAFTATSTYADNVTWSADDGRAAGRGSLTGGGEAWSWNWPIGTAGTGTPRVDWVVDGAYTINAQPFDSRGVPGELRVASVWLNRSLPLRPTGFTGGRSGGGTASGNVVEMDWAGNVERDIIGYRVYRYVNDVLDQRVCPLPAAGDTATRSLSCTDATAPNGGNLDYRLYAVDRTDLKDPVSTPRESATYAEIDVPTLMGPRLPQPTGLTATTNGALKPQLSWTAPTIPAGAGGSILFYRVYRDGVRIGRTSGSATSFVDPEPTGTSHTYEVAAIHSAYNEGHRSDSVVWRLNG